MAYNSVDNCNTKSAAQQRRLLENEEFALLARQLPLAQAISGQHIDKTTVVRLAASFLKLHELLSQNTRGYPQYGGCLLPSSPWYTNPLELMDSFLMVVDMRGDVLYVSETVSIYLGLSQVDMTGSQLRDYIHPDDWLRLEELFCHMWSDFINIRLKSSLTKRANKDSARASPGYKVIRMDITSGHGCHLLHCQPLPPLVLSTVSISSNSFVITLSVDFSIIGVDTKAAEIVGELGGACVSFYSLIDVNDIEIIRRMHYEIFALNTYRTPFYRLILHQSNTTVFVESIAYHFSSVQAGRKQSMDTVTIVTTLI